jgi:Flp pilus assembly protein TadG
MNGKAAGMRRGMLRERRGAEMAEAAITLPVVVLVLIFVINGASAGYTAMAAANAANYAAKVGAQAWEHAEEWASAAVVDAMRKSHAGGGYSYAVMVADYPGGAVKVTVTWSYPSMLSGLCRLVGGDCPKYYGGTVTATRKREGW